MTSRRTLRSLGLKKESSKGKAIDVHNCSLCGKPHKVDLLRRIRNYSDVTVCKRCDNDIKRWHREAGQGKPILRVSAARVKDGKLTFSIATETTRDRYWAAHLKAALYGLLPL